MYKILWLLLVVAGSAHGEIYKWVDEHGRVQYGDKPVKSAQTLSIDESPAVSSISKQQRIEKRNKLLQGFAEDRKEKNKKLAKTKKKQRMIKQRCLWARDRLKQYQRASSLYNLDAKGNRIVLSDKQRAATTKKLKASIRRYCK